MHGLVSAAAVHFPLRGEWRALNTPAERVPSHGTDFFAQRYAFDFVQTDMSGTWYYPGQSRNLLRHMTTGLPASRFFCWDKAVHSVSSGRVLTISDGWQDRSNVQWLWELLRSTVAPPRLKVLGDYRPLAGNYVMVEGADGVAFYAHLKAGSIRVHAGQQLFGGEILGTVGNSGNSTMPHLHFHLMDGPDPMTAKGVPCAFRTYERWVDGSWNTVDRGIPGSLERVRAAVRQPRQRDDPIFQPGSDKPSLRQLI